MNKPKLFKRTSIYGRAYWVCKSKKHEAYGDSPKEAYEFWESLRGLYKNGCVAQVEFDMQYYSALQAHSNSSVQ